MHIFTIDKEQKSLLIHINLRDLWELSVISHGSAW